MFTDPDPSANTARRAKPPIWAEGNQKPRFDARAFLGVTAANSRGLAVRGLATTAGQVGRIADRVAAGDLRVPQARLGRTGRYLPDHARVGHWLTQTAALAAAASEAALGAEPVEAMAFRGWVAAPEAAAALPTEAPPSAAPRAVPAETTADAPSVEPPVRLPRTATPPAPHRADADRDTLEAIRSLMHAAEVAPTRPQRRRRAPPAPPQSRAANLPDLAPAELTPPGPLFRLGARGVAGLAFALAFPVGAVQAALSHIKGVDLRNAD